MLILFSKYTMVGGIAALVHYPVLILLVEIFSINATLAAFCGAILGGLVAYTLNYFKVFKSSKKHKHAMVIFFTVAIIGIIMSVSIVHAFAAFGGHWYLAGQVIATLLHLAFGFLVNMRYAF